MKVWIIVFLMICTVSTYGQKKKSVVRNRLKTMIVYDQKNEKAVRKALKDSETKFDTQGNVSEEIEYEDSKVKKHMKYEYTDDGNKARETELDNDGKPTKIIEFKYDNDGKKIKEIELNSLGKASKTTEYKYDGELKTEKVVYDSNNKMKSKKTYQYQTY
jgi:hypothetical protein